ncbi:glycosyltransferase family 2 protein [Aerococcus kribbianus]|uniref:Glycosyltransferase family 2 protein n=1 Tax=Aerococcus kribbianus TaxID=2999064 RepID=A0A9X3FPR5_9LACT|nr:MULTISPECIES: glycosyltransferase family 2 protein [unclassified Aerococcus]MCZ0717316.1 glycosyltransferase family 2 protein [Aerococcus sp. YH-aer221]MCZ0725604.1 glycosyltransferase family 2 protein [Aerococcus sp. YH-aer222]
MSSSLSIVVPCYNEETSIANFIQSVEASIPNIIHDYLFVDDGSSDNTLAEIKNWQAKFPEQIHYLSFSRNFGKEAAIYAGLTHAQGDYVVLMDADLQDPPSLLTEMYHILTTSSYDCVGTRRSDRQGEPAIRSYFSKKFYQIINRLAQVKIVPGARDYRMMTRQMVDAVLEMTEANRFSKGLFAWVGFDTYYLSYDNIARQSGQTSWSFTALLSYALDGITAFSTIPLLWSSLLGFILFVLSILLGLFFLIRTLVFGNPTSGWTSLIVVILFVSGSQLFFLGIIGKYLSHIYLEVKNRPLYLVKESDLKFKNQYRKQR